MRAAGGPITLQALAHRGPWAWAAEPAARKSPGQAGLWGAVAKTHAPTAPCVPAQAGSVDGGRG